MDVLGDDRKKKRFDYEDYADVGARAIAIGSMVLSRGLTLEGLMTSYYSRNAGTYDTLLQIADGLAIAQDMRTYAEFI